MKPTTILLSIFALTSQLFAQNVPTNTAQPGIVPPAQPGPPVYSSMEEAKARIREANKTKYLSGFIKNGSPVRFFPAYPNVAETAAQTRPPYTVTHIEKSDILFMTPGTEDFAPAAITKLLQSPGKLLVVFNATYPPSAFRQFGENQNDLQKKYQNINPKQTLRSGFEYSAGLGKGCDILCVAQIDNIEKTPQYKPIHELISRWIARASANLNHKSIVDQDGRYQFMAR